MNITFISCEIIHAFPQNKVAQTINIMKFPESKKKFFHHQNIFLPVLWNEIHAGLQTGIVSNKKLGKIFKFCKLTY